jgi:predicted dehydrogenase
MRRGVQPRRACRRGRSAALRWTLLVGGILLSAAACESASTAPPDRFTGATGEVRLVTLDPGHFHAALVQKYPYDQIDPLVHVYAPDGSELDAHLGLVEQFNTREEDPTNWRLQVHRGDDFLERMLAERPGNVLVVAGNNGRKIEYVRQAVEAGMNVLTDKPIIIVPRHFDVLRGTLELADSRGLVVNDVMPERHGITAILQRELALFPDLFGTLERGSPDDPAINKESVHFFSKIVAGAPLVRPPWFFDVNQQGEAIVDVSTHMVDLVLWQSFPGEAVDYADPSHGVQVLSARTWSTPVTEAQFRHVTGVASFPDYLLPNVRDGVLHVSGNGEFDFTAHGVHGRVSVSWGWENPRGGDTHFSVMRGTRADLVIRQDEPQNFVATLYVEPREGTDPRELSSALDAALGALGERYPGLAARPAGTGYEIVIPEQFREGHEDHFTRVTQSFLSSLTHGALPEWERTNLLTKYFITTRAYELSR